MEKETKKLLIITYYFPPAGGPGVQRWLKFIKYLPDFGFQPIVYIPENPTYPIIDENLVSEISEKAIILKHKIFEPYQIASFFSKNKTQKISSGIIPKQKNQSFLESIFLWIRGNLFIPDARVYWVKPSVKYLEKYIQDNQIETVITSGPPHSLHLIGLKLKQKLSINWIADFRDPWTTICYQKALKLSNYAQEKHKNLESKVLNSSDLIIVTSKTTKSEFEVLTKKPIKVITNGFDSETIIGNDKNIVLDKKFSLAHIGSLLSDRNPIILWQLLSELIIEIPNFAENLEIKLVGKVSQDVLNTISEFKLNQYLNNLGYLSHKDAIENQQKSQVLLLIEINSEETKSIIPGKLFEYLTSKRPIIGIGPKNSDFESILQDTKAGFFFDYSEKETLKETVLEYYNLYLKENLKSNAINLEQYSRKNLTQSLVEAIENLKL